MTTDFNTDYLSTNQQSWDKRVGVHVDSDFYDVTGFINGKQVLNDIELSLLGDVKGKKILHLQCHFGQDSLALQQIGAEVVGLDFSPKAIEYARILADKMNLNAQFVCADVYSAPTVIHDTFDIVFTSYGTIGWLPDLDKWAKVVRHFLKPNGQFIMAEFHPVLWMYNNEFTEITFDYFKSTPIVEEQSGTYANADSEIKVNDITWNHSLSEVYNALKSNGLIVDSFEEFNYSPYNCFQDMQEIGPNRFVISTIKPQIPMVYALRAIATNQ
jgi:SAM-dependent methyltransferase